MSQAETLLNNLGDDISTRTMEPETEGHIVINNKRYITVPEALKRIAVQYDNNIETVTFDCPRYWDGHDLSVLRVYVNYMRPDGEIGSHLCTSVTIDENDPSIMHFDWTISGHVTEVNGDLSFLVCAKEVDEAANETLHWNSELNTEMSISAGLEPKQTITRKYPDIITQLLTRMDRLEECEVAVTGEQILNLQTLIVGTRNDLSEFEQTATSKFDDLTNAMADHETRITNLESRDEHNIDGDLTVTGTITANKIVGAVYM